MRRLVKAVLLGSVLAGLTACGGGGGDDDKDDQGNNQGNSNFSDVQGYFQQDGVWRVDSVIHIEADQTVTQDGASVTGSITSEVNMKSMVSIDYVNDNEIRFKNCESEPIDVMTLDEVRDESYFEGDEDFGDYCATETHSYLAIDENHFRIEVSCGNNLGATMTATRLSSTPDFDAGIFQFTTTGDQYVDLNAQSGVCGRILHYSAQIDFPQPNDLDLPDQNISAEDIEVGVNDYMGQPTVLSMTFLGSVTAGSYTVVTEDPGNGQVGDVMLSIGNSTELEAVGGQVQIDSISNSSASGTFSLQLVNPNTFPPEAAGTFSGSFEIDLDLANPT